MNKESQNIFIESWAAILMSFAALITAWSAYQANLWNGNQAVEIAQALDAQTRLSHDGLIANQRKMMDGIMSLEIAKELVNGNVKFQEFVL